MHRGLDEEPVNRALRWAHAQHLLALCASIALNAAILLIAVQTVSILFAQSDTGIATLRGRITDRTGGAAVGVSVRLVASGQTRAAKTDAFGDYRIAGLAPDVYQLQVDVGGFSPVRVDLFAPPG